MKLRKKGLTSLFDREYNIMKIYYNNKMKKHKKLKTMAQQFELSIDTEVRDQLLDEYFYTVCKLYCRMQMMIYFAARQQLKQKQESNR